MSEMIEFRKRLAEALDRKGMTQRELAEAIGVTEVSVSRYVCGDRSPRANILMDIANVLDCSIDWLLGCEKIFSSYIDMEDRGGCQYCNIEREDWKASDIPIDMGDFGHDYTLSIWISECRKNISVEFGESSREPLVCVHSDKIKYCPYCGREL